MEYNIEKNVPLTKVTKEINYPFSKMEIGDSFEIKAIDRDKMIKQRAMVISSATYYRLTINSDFKISTRNTSLFNLRVWRIK